MATRRSPHELVTPPKNLTGLKAYEVVTIPRWDPDAKELYVGVVPIKGTVSAGNIRLRSTSIYWNDAERGDHPEVPEGYVRAYLVDHPRFGDRGFYSPAAAIHPKMRVFCAFANGKLCVVSGCEGDDWYYALTSDVPCPAFAVVQPENWYSYAAPVAPAVDDRPPVQMNFLQMNGWNVTPQWFAVNGPWDIETNPDADAGTGAQAGIVTIGRSKPVWCRYNANTTYSGIPLAFSSWGPIANSWELHQGLPGFIALNCPSVTDAAGNPIGLFLQTPGETWCTAKVVGAWAAAGGDNPHVWQVDCHACAGLGGGYVYDGATTGPGGAALPDVHLTVYILGGSAPGTPGPFKTPNLQVDDFITYRQGSLNHTATGGGAYGVGMLVAVNDCLDDPIGTVKFWVGGAVPRGWRTYTGESPDINVTLIERYQ